MGVEADGRPTPSEAQVMSYPLQGESPSELNSEYNLEERSVFTVAVDPLIKSRENPDKMEIIPPEPINSDGRSFTSALYSINKEMEIIPPQPMNLDGRSFTSALYNINKEMEIIPPQPINLDGRSFTSALYNINKEDDNTSALYNFNKEDDDLLC